MLKITVDFEGAYRATYDVSKLITSGTTQSGRSFVAAEVSGLGKSLFLDRTLEGSELDEFIYHECLVHPALSHIGDNSHVGLIGGFEGASLREILRHKTVSTVSHIECDEELLSITSAHFPNWASGAFNDTRVAINRDDRSPLDALILDLPNHVSICESEVCAHLDRYIPRLEANGVITVNAGPCSLFSVGRLNAIKKHLNQHFTHVSLITFPMRSFMGLWGVLIAWSKDPFLRDCDFEDVLSKHGISPRYLTKSMYKNVFTPPEYLICDEERSFRRTTEPSSLVEITEPISEGITASYDVIQLLEHGDTPFQRYSIANIKAFGKTLFIEPQLQSSLIDEYIYHECLVHPAMLLSPKPTRVMIAGGGEGATLRDVLKHPSVCEAWMVDIDSEIVEMSKKHLTEWHQGAFSNPRSKIECTDARKWIEKTKPSTFDVIISDLSEPTDGGPSAFLFTLEFFKAVHKALSDDGVFVLQAGTADISQPECFACCTKTLSSVFPIVRPYQAHITSFLGPWAYVIASKVYDPLSLSNEEIKSRLVERSVSTKYYTPRMHQRIFDMPPYIENEISRKARVLTDASPFKW